MTPRGKRGKAAPRGSKASRHTPRDQVRRLADRLDRIERVVNRLVEAKVNVRREEHEALRHAVDQALVNKRDLEVQLHRIGQMQAELDAIKRRD